MAENNNHLQALISKHRKLDDQIVELFNHPSTPDDILQALKRRKLKIKETIAILETVA